MTDGSITEDSDTWLFGGKRVFKSFFGSEPCIDVYTIETIYSLLGSGITFPVNCLMENIYFSFYRLKLEEKIINKTDLWEMWTK